MSRDELKDIIRLVVEKVRAERDRAASDTPGPACIYSDQPDPCDATTAYGINEEG